MKILITGSNGFVGKNLVSTLAYLDEFEILTFNRNDDEVLLDRHTKDCDFVIHLAGVNRPLDKAEFYTGNVGLSEKLIASLKKNSNKAPILVTSSIQAELENDYGKSKKAGEELLYQAVTQAQGQESCSAATWQRCTSIDQQAQQIAQRLPVPSK